VVTLAYGEIVTVAGGTYTSKPRPVLVLQNPSFDTGNSVIVAPFTSVRNDDISPRLPVSPSNRNGLDRECYIELDKLSAIGVATIGKSVGHLESDLLFRVTEAAIKLVSPA
jgi:mRNA interferase MazF